MKFVLIWLEYTTFIFFIISGRSLLLTIIYLLNFDRGRCTVATDFLNNLLRLRGTLVEDLYNSLHIILNLTSVIVNSSFNKPYFEALRILVKQLRCSIKVINADNVRSIGKLGQWLLTLFNVVAYAKCPFDNLTLLNLQMRRLKMVIFY